MPAVVLFTLRAAERNHSVRHPSTRGSTKAHQHRYNMHAHTESLCAHSKQRQTSKTYFSKRTSAQRTETTCDQRFRVCTTFCMKDFGVVRFPSETPFRLQFWKTLPAPFEKVKILPESCELSPCMGLNPAGACEAGPAKFLAGDPPAEPGPPTPEGAPSVAPRLTGKVEFSTELVAGPLPPPPCSMGPIPDSGSICNRRNLLNTASTQEC